MNNLVHMIYSIILISSLAPRSIQCGKKVYNVTCSCIVQMDCEGDCLESIANDIVEGMDVQIDIRASQVHLNSALRFANLTSISITGDFKFGTPNVICSATNHYSDSGPGVGIIVSNATNHVSLSNLRLSKCGSIVDIAISNKTYRSALSILACKNVSVTRVTIEESDGVGFMMQSYQGDTVHINSSVFSNNKLHSFKYGSQTVYGGGGVNIVIDPGLVIDEWIQPRTTLYLYNCQFESNIANNTHYRYMTKAMAQQEHSGNAWQRYDIALRKKAANKRLTKWSDIDPTLWNRAFSVQSRQAPFCSICMDATHATTACPLYIGRGQPQHRVPHPLAPPRAAASRSTLTLTEDCKRNPCPRRHKCLAVGCEGDHPHIKCPKLRSSPRKNK